MAGNTTLHPNDVNLDTIEGTLNEVNEWSVRVQKTVQKMSHMKQGEDYSVVYAIRSIHVLISHRAYCNSKDGNYDK